MRKIQNKDDFYCDPVSGSFHAPMLDGLHSKPIDIFGRKHPQTETELRIKRGYNTYKKQCKNYIENKYIECSRDLKKLFTDDGFAITNEIIIKYVKKYVDKIPNWEKPSNIIKSNRNASLGLYYKIRKGRGEKISKKDFLKKYKIKEKHLNKVLQFLSRISLESRKESMINDILLNYQLSETKDDFEVSFDRFYILWNHLEYLLKLKKRFDREKRLYGMWRKDKYLPKSPKKVSEGNPFVGFMSCMSFLKFIRECEDAHYEYLLKNKVFYNRGAFFIDFDISNFFKQIDFFYKFQEYEEREVLQKILEGILVELIEEFVDYNYENDEGIDVYKKSELCVQKLPLNFIQVIKESGFTPPFCI